MLTVKNTAKGPRGFNDVHSGQVMLDPGAEATEVVLTDGERKSMESTGYFEITHAQKAKAATKAKADPAPEVVAPEAPVAEEAPASEAEPAPEPPPA